MRTPETNDRFRRSHLHHDDAATVFPAGVNSGLRSFEQPVPLAFSHGSGSRIVDLDGNEYIDYQLGQGALFLGHAHPGLTRALGSQLKLGSHFAAQSEIELSAGRRILDALPSVERVRFTNSATEAMLAATRIARAATGRGRLIRFEGHYHGWSDEGLAGFAPPRADWLDDHTSRPSHPSSGVLREPVDQFLVGRFNDPEGLLALVEGRDDLAGIVLEPVMCNTGCIAPEPAFVAAIGEARRRSACLVIADETITGLRFGRAGAQARYGLKADLTVLGKAIGAGVPVAAFGGRSDLMDLVARGVVGHAGTLNGNPLCMAAVDYVLGHVSEGMLQQTDQLAAELGARLSAAARDFDLPLLVQQEGPVVYTAFSRAKRVRDYRDVVEQTDPERWAHLRLALLLEGVRVLERGLWYLSLAHTERDLADTASAFARAVARVEEVVVAG